MSISRRNVTNEILITRQKRATWALVFNAATIIGLYLWVDYIFLTSAVQPILGIFYMSVILLPIALIPLWLAYQLYRGKYFRRWLQRWAGTCLIIGLIFLIPMIQVMSIGLQNPYFLYSILFGACLCSFLLVPSGFVLHLTGISTWSRSIDVQPSYASSPFIGSEEE